MDARQRHFFVAVALSTLPFSGFGGRVMAQEESKPPDYFRAPSFAQKPPSSSTLASDSEKKTAEAKSGVNEVLGLPSTQEMVLRNLARTAWERGDMHEAIRQLGYLIEKNQADYPTLVIRAWAYAQIGDLRSALVDADSAVSYGPLYDASFLTRASIHMKRGRIDLGLADCDRAAELWPGRPESWVSRGRMLAEAKEYRLALAAFDEAKRLGWNDDYLDTWRGCCLGALGRLSEAEAAFDSAVHKGPGDPNAYASRGGYHAQSGRDAEALADYLEAIRVAPQSSRWRILLAVQFAKMGDLRSADLALAEASRIDPSLVMPSIWRAFLEFDPPRIVRRLDDVVRDHPDSYQAWLLRAVAKHLNKDDEGGLIDIDRVLEIHPEFANAYVARAHMLADREDYPGASEAAGLRCTSRPTTPRRRPPWLAPTPASETMTWRSPSSPASSP